MNIVIAVIRLKVIDIQTVIGIRIADNRSIRTHILCISLR